MSAHELSILADIQARLARIEANTAKPEKNKKNTKDIETPEQWNARLKTEFRDEPDFDGQIAKCREYYRVKRKAVRRDTIEDWLLRQRKWRQEHGTDGPAKKQGFVL